MNTAKKTLILSRQDDGSTSNVIEWIVKYGKPYIRINTDDDKTKLDFVDIDARELTVSKHGEETNLFDIASVWHRRRGFSLKNVSINEEELNKGILFDTPNYHKKHVNSEYKVLTEYFHYILERDVPTIGNYKSTDVNKLIVLEIAKKYGVPIPRGYVVSTKKALKKVLDATDASFVITKAISQGVYHFTKEYGYYTYTERITEESLAALPDRFFPSLIQEEIKKKYELRVFYLNEEFYAMAIFSQKCKDTVVDFRKHTDQDSPQRKVPYNLPEHVKTGLIKIMNELELNTGSIDILVDEDNNYIFLEVNPVGQFGMTSAPCNYYLERKIANIL
ncbi:grasp-with-spasm system ATP-grasp peptide maturase [Kordia algicida OT-1]|nr:grasp-with-spasm system ATP-grasp peptide maturase [Kordia algicida]